MRSRKTAQQAARPAGSSGDSSGDTRRRLLDAAVSLFLEVGYHNLRIEDITNHAGLGKGTFYLHFQSKRDLLLAYFQDVVEHIEAVEAEAASDGIDPLSRVNLRIRSALDVQGNWNKTNTFLRIAANSTDADISTAAREVHARMAEAAQTDMAAAIARHEFREIHTELASLAMVGMQEVLAWRAGQDSTYSAEQLFDFVVDVHRRVLIDPVDDSVLPWADRMVESAAQATNESTAVALTREPLDTREKLLVAAVDLFLDEGYSNLRISDITDYAGVGKGTFYLHFASKRDLLLAYFERVLQLVKAVEAEATSGDLDHFSKTGLRMSSALDREGKWNKVVTFLRISSNSDDAEVAGAARDIHNRMLEPAMHDLTVAMRHGLVRDLDAELAALAWAGMQEVVAWRADQDDQYDKATITAFLADVYVRAFVRAPGASPASGS